MKIIYELDSEKDDGLLQIYNMAERNARVVYEFTELLRRDWKYGEYSDDVNKYIDGIRDKWFDLLREDD